MTIKAQTDSEQSDWQELTKSAVDEYARGTGSLSGALLGIAAVADRLTVEVLSLRDRVERLESRS